MSSFDREKYISLATFRKTGKAVETPVWFAQDTDDSSLLYVFTAGESGKIKRLRNSPRSKIAACSARGKVHGHWIDSETRIVGNDEQDAIQRSLRHLRKKYRLSMAIADLGARLTGRYGKRAYLEVRLSEPTV